MLVTIDQPRDDLLSTISADDVEAAVQLITIYLCIGRCVEIPIPDGNAGAAIVAETGDLIGQSVTVGILQPVNTFPIFQAAKLHKDDAIRRYDDVTGLAKTLPNGAGRKSG